ncbi:MAG: class I SAM-dependent methyltransferase [Bacteroidales bacterium]
MKNTILHSDPLGLAYTAFQKGDKEASFILQSEMFDDDSVPVSYFFREYEEMPAIEQIALQSVYGRVLDVGAGSGSHSLYLQEHNYAVTALDISPLAVEVMKKRGLTSVVCHNFFEYTGEKYDTLLFLMNGIGLVETCSSLPLFFKHASSLLKPNGQIILDSSDLIYLFETEDGSILLPLSNRYYGEISYKVMYENYISHMFNWLYVDFQTLCEAAHDAGFTCELVQQGNHYDYMARLQKV